MEAVEKQGGYSKDLCKVTSLASGYVGMRKRADVLWQALAGTRSRVPMCAQNY